MYTVLRVDGLLGGRSNGSSAAWMLTRIWISTLNMPLIMPMLGLRLLRIMRVLHHYGCGPLDEGTRSRRGVLELLRLARRVDTSCSQMVQAGRSRGLAFGASL